MRREGLFLPWERPEAGSLPRRLLITIVLLGLRPARAARSLTLRRAHAIAGAPWLVACYSALSLLLCTLAFAAASVAFFLRRGSGLLATFDRAAAFPSMALACGLAISPIACGALIGVLLRRFSRRQLRALGTLDFLSLLGVAIPLGASVVLANELLRATSDLGIGDILILGPASQAAFLFGSAWYLTRYVARVGPAGAASIALVAVASNTTVQIAVFYGFYVMDDRGLPNSAALGIAVALVALPVAVLLNTKRYPITVRPGS